MRLEYEVNRNDTTTFAKSMIRLRNSLSQHIMNVLLISAVIAVITHILLTATLEFWSRPLQALPALPTLYLLDIVLFILTGVLCSLLIIRSIKKDYRQLISENREHITLRYNKDGLEYQHGKTYRQQEWPNVDALIKSHCAVYLRNSDCVDKHDDCEYIIIPRQIFSSTAEFVLFVDFIEANAAKSIHIS